MLFTLLEETGLTAEQVFLPREWRGVDGMATVATGRRVAMLSRNTASIGMSYRHRTRPTSIVFPGISREN